MMSDISTAALSSPQPAAGSADPPIVAPAAVAAPVAESAPVVAAEVAAPALVAAESAPAVEAPVEQPAPVEGAAPVVEAPAAEAKPPEEGAAKPEVVAEPVKPAYPEFKIPEGVKAEPAVMSAYNNVLGKYAIPAEAGQELLDFHANQMRAAQQQMVQQQQDTFAETRKGFVRDFEKAAGNRRDTILGDAKWAINYLIPDKKQRAEFHSVLAFTGAGDHKAVIGALASAAKHLREREAPGPGVPSQTNSTSAADRRYGGKKN